MKANSSIEEIVRAGKIQNSLDVTFRLTYTLKDFLKTKSLPLQRDVVLLNSPKQTPILVEHGDNPHLHEVNTEFVDPGVTAYKEIGEGQEPRNLNEYVIINPFLLTVTESNDSREINPIDPTEVNFLVILRV